MTEKATNSTDKPKKRAIRHLTASQKAQAIELWRSGEVTLDDLARKFKKNRDTFSNLFKREGVEKGSAKKELERRVQEKVQEDLANDAVVLANRIRETKEEHYKMAAGIAKLVWFTITKARQDNKPIASVGYDLKALKVAAETLRITREDRYAVLGISPDDDGEEKPLPDLVVQELTAEDIRKMQRDTFLKAADDLDVDPSDLGDSDLLTDHPVEDDESDRVVEGDD